MSNGKLIAIEGIDGTGKETQAKMLRDNLTAMGYSVTIISYPRYGRSIGADLVQQYLKGDFGKLNVVPPLLAALPYALDRAESIRELAGAVASHDVVILDRYVMSNMAHQGAKLDPDGPREELITQIDAIEHGTLGLPEPDLVILLTLPIEEAVARINARPGQNDMHEADVNYLTKVAETYDYLADESDLHIHRIPGMKATEDESNYDNEEDVPRRPATRFEVAEVVLDAAMCEIDGHERAARAASRFAAVAISGLFGSLMDRMKQAAEAEDTKAPEEGEPAAETTPEGDESVLDEPCAETCAEECAEPCAEQEAKADAAEAVSTP